MKCCLQCERPAEFSLCAVISTLGVSGRHQKCTTALPFCLPCLQRFCIERERDVASRVQQALKTALCALTDQRLSETTPKTGLEGRENGLEAGERS